MFAVLVQSVIRSCPASCSRCATCCPTCGSAPQRGELDAVLPVHHLDYPIVSYYFGATANGIYALAYWIVLEAVKTISNVIIEVAFPTFARLRHDPPTLVKQFLRLTRLNLIAVLPFVVLNPPDRSRAARCVLRGRPVELAGSRDLRPRRADPVCRRRAARARLHRAPLLDGIGQPELTLRYMTIAAIVVPAAFVLGAVVLGDRLGLLSVAVAWAVGYPLAFAMLIYLVAHMTQLSILDYLRSGAGIVACAGPDSSSAWRSSSRSTSSRRAPATGSSSPRSGCRADRDGSPCSRSGRRSPPGRSRPR